MNMIVVLITLSAIVFADGVANRTFTVDYENDRLLKDGHPFRFISGTLQYYQIPRELWRDRMIRMRALGCNALQTYVQWSRHQPLEKLQYNFVGDANITEYLSLAQELGFVVLLRMGPYIDAEVDFGGFPYWLLKKKGIILRSSKDKRYLKAVQDWLSFLLPAVVKPLLYANGGPIVLVQIENEYGSYPACDKKYMLWMKALAQQYLGNSTVLTTSDGPTLKYLGCGAVPGVLPTVDFGTGSKAQVDQSLTIFRQVLPHGPMINAEFYPGWFDKWGKEYKHATVPIPAVLNSMRFIWNWNVTSINIYPAHGGSLWGYNAGGEGPPFETVTTGYDYDAPISEAGDTTPKFLAMRQLIEELTGRKIQDPIPASPPKHAYDRVRMEWVGTVLDLLHAITPVDQVVNSTYPLTMEDIDHPFGFLLYETVIPKSKGRLEVGGVKDRAYVMLDGQLVSVIQRKGDGMRTHVIPLSRFSNASLSLYDNVKVQILVENQGRICFGPKISDPKGLLSNVTLDGQILTNWTMYPIDLSKIYQLDVSQLKNPTAQSPMDRAGKYLPSIYYGYFFANSELGDTFFDPSGWGKGQVFINGRNIGRYWPQAGPQITLYVPGVYLTRQDDFNQIFAFELDQPGACETEEKFGCWVQFGDHAKYSK